MPVIKSAKKKLRQDKKRTFQNRKQKADLKTFLKTAKKNPTKENIRLATKAADKAAKKHLLHKNKANHLKSFLSKLLGEKSSKEAAK